MTGDFDDRCSPDVIAVGLQIGNPIAGMQLAHRQMAFVNPMAIRRR